MLQITSSYYHERKENSERKISLNLYYMTVFRKSFFLWPNTSIYPRCLERAGDYIIVLIRQRNYTHDYMDYYTAAEYYYTIWYDFEETNIWTEKERLSVIGSVQTNEARLRTIRCIIYCIECNNSRNLLRNWLPTTKEKKKSKKYNTIWIDKLRSFVSDLFS